VVPPVAARPLEYAVPCVPEGKPDVVIARADDDAAAMAIERLTDLVCAGFPASVTVAVKLDVPLAVGVPEIRPVLEDRLSPAGRLPDVTDQVYGVVPPVAAIEFEYAVPCVPEGRLDVVMLKAVGATGADAAATVRVTVAVAVLSVFPQPVVAVESVTLTPKE
jgi:hypothetical protein